MSFIAIDEEGKVILYKNKKWMTKEEALKIYSNTWEDYDAIRQKWEQSFDWEKHKN